MINRREFLVSGSMAIPALLAPGTLTGSTPAPDGAIPASPPRRQPEHFEQVARLITEKMAEHRITGVAFGVRKAGTVTIRGFGVTNVEEPQPITSDTVFPIASISKTFIATAVMRLVEQGRVELRAPVRRYLPDFRVEDEGTTSQLSLWHMLTHTPGFEGQISAPDRGSETLSDFMGTFPELPQLAPAGAVWSYNNAGFGVAARVIEVVTERSIHDALRELVYEPLELSRAMSRTGDAITYRVALPHRERGGETQVIRPFNLSANVGAGGVATTIADLLSYGAFHLGERAGDPVLSPASLELMRTAQLRKNPTDDDIGLAWQLRRLDGVVTAAHGGTLGGHCLHLQIVPERRLAFSILTNHANGWRLIQDVERATLRLYEGLSLTPNQRICHRGVNEAMNAHSTPLAEQPDLREYVGTYRRPPVGTVEVRVENGTLRAGNTSLVFYGPDVAYATAGGYVGQPYEFVRTPDRRVGWIRVNGRIARKT
jgi:CubicO group peptidase (beta-lactamase class C family)